jgi:hypothetical protein
VKPGDEVVTEIEKIGCLTNTIVGARQKDDHELAPAKRRSGEIDPSPA